MSIHTRLPLARLEVPESLRPWRSQYPKFGELIDAGASPLKALRYLGLALWQDGRLNDAASVLKTAVASAPDQPQILTDLGSVLCAAGRGAEATHYLTASLDLDPRQLHAWINLAGLYHQSKEMAKAEHAFRTALELQPESAEAAAGLGLLYIEQRLFEPGCPPADRCHRARRHRPGGLRLPRSGSVPARRLRQRRHGARAGGVRPARLHTDRAQTCGGASPRDRHRRLRG